MGSETPATVISSELAQQSEQCEEMAIAQRVFVGLMEQKHIPQVCEMERLCFAVPWTEKMFADELHNPLTRYVVLLDRQSPTEVVAYGGYWKIFEEGHIINIAVHPSWQGQKAGTYLMEQMMQFAAAEGVQAMTLEVRPSNTHALKLYEKLGFVVEGRRKGYYEDNGEDALIMWYRAKGEETHNDN